jgi:hypothetical protein
LPLLEKIRIELFIPDLPDPKYNQLLQELGDELSYTFGGCTVIPTQGKYHSNSGFIMPDKINVLFTDTPLLWDKDKLLIEQYAQGLHQVVQKALSDEEAILISVYPVYHIN